MRLEDFVYDLPRERIAQHPPEQRDGGRLLTLGRSKGAISHRSIVDLPDLVEPGTVMVVNDSRVIPARLWAHRKTGGRAELLLLERTEATWQRREIWHCMLRASKTPARGEILVLDRPNAAQRHPQVGETGARSDSSETEAVVLDRPVGGRCRVALLPETPQRLGQIPLPPYIERADGPIQADSERYQTVYACADGSVAAPTAGLHLTEPLLDRLRDRNVALCSVTLHVGPGTFQPVRCEQVDAHQMEHERFEVPAVTAEAIARAKTDGRPVLAVGTTVVRTLEASGGLAGSGRTNLFIRPGHRFGVVDRLLTNFHLPGSTLLMLVSALAGRERILAAYAEAVDKGYRFYSYGDAMLIN